MKTFYNTIQESGGQLSQSKARARSQQERILAFFRSNENRAFTPFEIQANVLPGAPITSVRRAITNLEKAGLLNKSHFACRKGKHGKNNYTWRLSNDEKQEQLGLF